MKVLFYKDSTVGEIVVCEADESGTMAAGTYGSVLTKWPGPIRENVSKRTEHGLLVLEAESEQDFGAVVRNLLPQEWDRIRRNLPLWA